MNIGDTMGDGTEKGLLGRLSVLVGILVGIATIASIYWTIFHKDSTDVADYQSQVTDYQNQVVATCEQVHKVLAAEHNEALDLGGHGSSTPGNLWDDLRVRRDVMIQVMVSNIAQARIGFDALNRRTVPEALKAQHADAVAAQQAYFNNAEQLQRTIRDRLGPTAPVSKLQALFDASGQDKAGATLNAAMTVLAGRNCQVTA
jgi:hypothetical protein